MVNTTILLGRPTKDLDIREISKHLFINIYKRLRTNR